MRGSRCSSSRLCSFRKARRSKASCRPTRARLRPPSCGGWPRRWPRIPAPRRPCARRSASRSAASRSASRSVAARRRQCGRASAPRPRQGSERASAGLPAAARLRLRPVARRAARDLDINEATLDVRWEDGPEARPDRRIHRGGRRRSGEPVLLCAGRSERPAYPDAIGPRAIGSQPAVPSADGLCGGDEDHRVFRASARPRGAVGAAGDADRARARKSARSSVQRLRIYPHALRAKNAYYSPERKALLLGYFTALDVRAPERRCPEAWSSPPSRTTSSRTRRRMRCSTACTGVSANPPTRTSSRSTRRLPTSSRCSSTSPCRKRCATRSRATRGDLEKQNLLGQLAVQFGEATGRYGALRDYIGKRMVSPPTTGR